MVLSSWKTYLIPLFLALLVLSGINIYRWFPSWSSKYYEGHENERTMAMKENVQVETTETSQRVYQTLKSMLKVAVTGEAPFIESTVARRERYLKDHDYSVKEAVLSLVEKRHGFSESTKSWILRNIPVAGVPVSLVRTLWLQVRDTALIASLYGHNLEDEDVLAKIVLSLVSADTSKVPKLMIDRAFKAASRRIAESTVKSALSRYLTSWIPFGIIIDYFLGGESAVSHQAIVNFSPEHDASFFKKHETWMRRIARLFLPRWAKGPLDPLKLPELIDPAQEHRGRGIWSWFKRSKQSDLHQGIPHEQYPRPKARQ
jgi:hypothetical protein